jgi:addiction module RelE/StbE family toxin
MYSVEFSERAEIDLERILDYLTTRFGPASANKYYQKIEVAVNQLESFPFAYPESGRQKGLRKCVIRPYTLLFYEVVDRTVYVSALLDGRINLDSAGLD